MVEELFDDLLILDEAGTILYVMPGTAARISAGDLVGMVPEDWLSPLSAETLLRAVRTSLESRTWLDASLRIKDREGEGAVLDVAVGPFRRTGGRVLVLGRNLLVSLLKAGAAGGQVGFSDLFLQVDKMASLGQLTAGVAHEINNPTQFIRENIRIIREALTDLMPIIEDRHREQPDLRVARLPFPFFREQIPLLAADIESGATRIRDLVASLKQYARSDEGKLDEVVDLAQIMATSLRLIFNQTKNIAEVTQEIEPGLPCSRGNVQQIEQVVVSILINACQAIQGGKSAELAARSKGKIRISASHDSAANTVCLSVADDGPGMRAEVVRRIFDPFFTTRQNTGGTGLGLSIVYGIIEKHGGRIDVDSVPGQGTEFTISLPVIGKEPHGE